ncbi:hypothetical protein PF003_g15307 [Phytophthora fragariae]|nr:hypothetical protein PF003_g15307 [Phytophthora fragariae]
MQKKRDFILGKMKEAFGSKTGHADELKAQASHAKKLQDRVLGEKK